MQQRRDFIKIPLATAAALAMGGTSLGLKAQPASAPSAASVTLLNVSYDPTREFYVEFNAAFAKYWKGKTGQDVTVKQSHGGSGKQARSILDGLDADVATLALAFDTDALYEHGKLIPKDWQKRLPHNASPYQSTIVLVVREGNPKGIKDWDDLVKPGIKVITPNPKTSGGARWNYLAAWEFARRKYGGSEAQAKAFVAKLFENVPVLDTGARGSTITFAQRGMGDVLIAWENEAYLLEKEFGNKVDVVYPSVSILAEPAVTVVDKNVDKKGTRAVAQAYLEYLYTEEGQDIIGKNFYRPISPKAQAKYAKQFPKLNLVTVDKAFGGWTKASAEHFADGASFDQIYTRR
jgi:sulfate transport system substrate-binding protein